LANESGGRLWPWSICKDKRSAEFGANNSSSYIEPKDDKGVKRAELYAGANLNMKLFEETLLKTARSETARNNVAKIVEHLHSSRSTRR